MASLTAKIAGLRTEVRRMHTVPTRAVIDAAAPEYRSVIAEYLPHVRSELADHVGRCCDRAETEGYGWVALFAGRTAEAIIAGWFHEPWVGSSWRPAIAQSVRVARAKRDRRPNLSARRDGSIIGVRGRNNSHPFARAASARRYLRTIGGHYGSVGAVTTMIHTGRAAHSGSMIHRAVRVALEQANQFF